MSDQTEIPEPCERCESLSAELRASEDDVELCPACRNLEDLGAEALKLAEHFDEVGMRTHADLMRRLELALRTVREERDDATQSRGNDVYGEGV